MHLLKNILIISFFSFLILLVAEFLARKLEKVSYQNLKPIAYHNLKEDIPENLWSIKNLNECTNDDYTDFLRIREPLVPDHHLNENDLQEFTIFTNELFLTLHGRGPRVNGKRNIFILGGSTIMGDNLECQEHTLPALLNFNVKEDISFHNHGYSAYSSFETSNYFLKWIKYFDHPQEFWFVEGINDVMHKVIKGIPSYHFSFTSIGMSRRIGLRFFIIESLASRSALFRMLSGINPIFNSSIVEGPNLKPTAVKNIFLISQEENIKHRAKIASKITLRNYSFIKEIASYKNIDLKFFIQPNIFNKKSFSKIEEKIFEKMDDLYPIENLKLAFSEYNKNLLKYSSDFNINFYDLRVCISNVDKTIYSDVNHLTPQGNQIVAKCILNNIF
ncbi:MAG: hypothetical protein CMM95_00465 [Rickettsiales bacterium]|nr:hypothetical protein [Rickettsiales bacterium]|tara:strand:- start:337 stop:1503 length:1167 start_codon:yes stop_codon:yes gene_type:complete